MATNSEENAQSTMPLLQTSIGQLIQSSSDPYAMPMSCCSILLMTVNKILLELQTPKTHFGLLNIANSDGL